MDKSERRGTSERSQARRAELIAIGRALFADTSYDALSMDDIARHAGVAKGLIYYYFTSKHGYYLAIVEDSAAGLLSRAAAHPELPRAERVRRTVDGYLRYAQNNEAAFRTIVTGGVGCDTEVQTIRDAVREELIAAIAEGAYGRRDLPPLARLALLGWLSGVEQIALDWLGRREPDRDRVCALLTRLLRSTLTAIGEFEPGCPEPPLDQPLPAHPPTASER
ncbi:TetR/AcrR family transcriptional regulator [Streptomyces katsurahamanus]|uniref:TetR/AcrR family transcriptional regulator n=1 Tax=Streptomyces katsurahamanus TaxID=2577098 RepID=A0ABW9NSV3_9ACTN|nr:TetR/AcrR family transcriptional regulator [Streptomyces katsurahamanus]MQS36239.1 TetR/AcrR family transcriptional regulator [Streptomyces katsurahamanus]